MSARRDDELPLSGQRKVDDDVRGELEFHLEQRIAELVARGTPPDEARRTAMAAFGDRDRVEAECREIETRRRVADGRARRLDDLRDDARIGLRLLRRSPAYALAAVATLALGVGANTAVFSIVNDVVLTPLPYEDADRLVHVVERHEQGSGNVPWATFLDLEATAQSFSAMAAYGSGTTTVLGTDRPLRVNGAWISSNFFRVFPTRPVLGRLPLPEEHALGASPVAVVSHAFWRDRLGAPESLEGIRVKLGFDYDVIGVLPPAFEFPDEAQVWMPLELSRQGMSRTSHNWNAIGRMGPGVTPQAAQRELDQVLARLRELHYPDFDAVGATVTPLHDVLTASTRTPLYLLLGASAILLVAACTNLASAGLARGTNRLGDMAVRSALGATRSRLVRQLLTESALLALVGVVAGLAVAMLLLRVVTPFAPEGLRLERVAIDGRVLAFATVVAVVTTILTGLWPALRLSGTNVGTMLRAGLRGSADAGRMRTWNFLVSAEVALAIVLLAGSGLLIRSFTEVIQTEIGFEPEDVTWTAVEIPAINYDGQSPAIPAFHEQVLASLQGRPGIEAAGFVNRLPLTGTFPNGAMEVEGKPHDRRGAFTGYSIYRVIGGDYFQAMGIPVLAGRTFGAADDRSGAPVVIVSRTFAERQWPGEDAIGKRLRVAGMDGGEEPWTTVVGVVGDTRASSVTDPWREVYYFDHRQRPPYRTYSTSYVVRGPSAAGAVVAAIESIDPQVPVEQRNLESLVSRSVADRRFMLIIMGGFAALALALATVGIYAVVSYTVAQRTREIGVRLALGATPSAVRSMVIRGSLRSLAPGLLIGGLLAVGATSAMRSLLYGVSPLDPIALGSAVAILAAAGVMSTLPPAVRATRVDPLTAIRSD